MVFLLIPSIVPVFRSETLPFPLTLTSLLDLEVHNEYATFKEKERPFL
jgi:hypothetical protein